MVVLGFAALLGIEDYHIVNNFKRKYLAPSATPWDGLPEQTIKPAELLVKQSHRSMYAFRHESFFGDIDFINSYERKSCPLCGSSRIRLAGLSKAGLQRYWCTECKGYFTPATDTIFEDRKLPLSAWVDFLLQLFSHESISSMTREDRRSETTHPYWLAKVFMVLEGIQDGVVLSGNVQIDETYYPISLKDAARKDGKLLRGLSRNQMCIGVGCDSNGKAVFVWEGFGKTSKKKTRCAFGERITAGSHLVHDKERAHAVLVNTLEITDSPYDSKLLKGLPDDENPLADVNRHCKLLKHFLKAHSGFGRDNLQGFLDVFYVISNPPENKMEKVAFVLDRAMHSAKSLRYRDFYSS